MYESVLYIVLLLLILDCIMIPRSGGAIYVVLEGRGSFGAGITFSPGGEQDVQMKGPRMFPDFRCPSASSAPFACVLAEAENNDVLLTAFDPVQGRSGEAASVPVSPAKFFGISRPTARTSRTENSSHHLRTASPYAH